MGTCWTRKMNYDLLGQRAQAKKSTKSRHRSAQGLIKNGWKKGEEL